MWLAQGLLLGAILAVMIEGLCGASASFLPAVGRRGWLAVRLAGAALLLALGVIVWRAQSSTAVTPTTCVVVKPSIRAVTDDGEKLHEVALLVRWTVDGRNLRLKKPLTYDRFRAAEHPVAELERRFAPGTSIDCAFQKNDPTRVMLRSADAYRTDRSFIVAAFLWSGALLAAFALVRVLRPGPPPRPRPRRRGVTLVRLGFLAAALGATAVSSRIGWLPLAGLAVLFVVVSLLEIRSAERGLSRVRARLVDARPWPRSDEAKGFDPYGDDRSTGLWRGTRVWVALTSDGPLVRVALARWPERVALDPQRAATDASTGDPAFDGALGLRAADEGWRPVLTFEVRRRLVALVAGRGGAIDEQVLELHLADQHARALPDLLDEAVALADALPEVVDVDRDLLRAIEDEPVAAVRRGHYEHLVGRGFEVPVVLRQAAADPDPNVASWARAQLPRDGGAYR